MLSNKPLIFRSVIFLLLFITATGIIGPWIIKTRLLYGFNFFIYGNLGKVIIFGTIAFFLMAKKQLATFRGPRWRMRNLVFFLLSQIATTIFFPMAKRLLREPDFFANITLSINTHLVAISIPALIFLSVFGYSYSVKFFHRFRKYLALSAGISAVFYFAIFYIWKFWPILSTGVMYSVYALLKLSFESARIVPPLTLIVEGFAVKIEQACSGVDSIFLFSALYILLAIIDRKVFDLRKILTALPLALIGLYGVNILRVYLLVLFGVLISPELTVKLFHTYLGMILFIIYFALFWRLFYNKLKKLPTPK